MWVPAGETRGAPSAAHGGHGLAGQAGQVLGNGGSLGTVRLGKRPTPATLVVVIGCVGVWVASVAAGGQVWSGSVRGPLDEALARNAVLIAGGQWWRALSYASLNLSLYALVYVMALLLFGGAQLERTYGTARFLAILVPSSASGALVALFVEPAHAFNAGTSGATFGVVAAAAIDLIRKGVPWWRTFWVPTLLTILPLGFAYPAGVTWGAHVGGILAGGLIGLVACDPRRPRDRGRLAWTAVLALFILAGSLLAAPFAARHTVEDGPVFIGAGVGPGAGRSGSPSAQYPSAQYPSRLYAG